jgi:hypothetical protein
MTPAKGIQPGGDRDNRDLRVPPAPGANGVSPCGLSEWKSSCPGDPLRLDRWVIDHEQASEKMFHAEVEATSLCNTRCLHCPHEAISRPGGKMTWETYTVIVEKIRAYVKGQPYSLSYSGMGEPMLNPLIYRFVKHVSDEATTAFSSNGAVLTERMSSS